MSSKSTNNLEDIKDMLEEGNKDRIKEIKDKEAKSKKSKEDLKKAVHDSIQTKQEADKAYIVNHTKVMLDRCKKDEIDTIVGERMYGMWFGKVYTFLLNGVPVTIKFDGTPQKFPRFVAEVIRKKLVDVANSNFPKEENTKLAM